MPTNRIHKMGGRSTASSPLHSDFRPCVSPQKSIASPIPGRRRIRKTSSRSKRSIGEISLDEIPTHFPFESPKKARIFEKTKICAEIKYSLSSTCANAEQPQSKSNSNKKTTCANLLDSAAPLTVISPCPWLQHRQPSQQKSKSKTRRASAPSVLPSRASCVPQSIWRNCSGNKRRRRHSCPSAPPFLALPEASMSLPESKARPERVMAQSRVTCTAAGSLRTVGKRRLALPESVVVGLREDGETSCDSDDTDDDHQDYESATNDANDEVEHKDKAKQELQEEEREDQDDDETSKQDKQEKQCDLPFMMTQCLKGRTKMVMRQRLVRSCVTEWRVNVEELTIVKDKKQFLGVEDARARAQGKGHTVIFGVQLADQKGSHTVYTNERGSVFKQRIKIKRGLKIKEGSQITVRVVYDEAEDGKGKATVDFLYELQGKAVQIDSTPVVIDNLKPFGCGVLAKVFVAQNERAKCASYSLKRTTHTLVSSATQ